MSYLLELAGKAGTVCPQGFTRTGPCPMLVRASSEDVLVANIFAILKNLSPQKWLGQWLDRSFGTSDFERARFEDLQFEFWASLPPPPGLSHREGRSKPDLIIHFDDVTVLCEAKYHSPLSSGTAHHSGRNQLIRFIDVVDQQYGSASLFQRRLFVMTLSIEVPALVTRYRDSELVVADLTAFNCAPAAARAIADRVGVGASTWQMLAETLAAALDDFGENPVEEAFALDALAYLALKLSKH